MLLLKVISGYQTIAVFPEKYQKASSSAVDIIRISVKKKKTNKKNPPADDMRGLLDWRQKLIVISTQT